MVKLVRWNKITYWSGWSSILLAMILGIVAWSTKLTWPDNLIITSITLMSIGLAFLFANLFIAIKMKEGFESIGEIDESEMEKMHFFSSIEQREDRLIVFLYTLDKKEVYLEAENNKNTFNSIKNDDIKTGDILKIENIRGSEFDYSSIKKGELLYERIIYQKKQYVRSRKWTNKESQ